MDFLVERALQSAPAEDDFAHMSQANIKVIGVGGAGNNMVGWLYKKGIKGAEIIATNTDHQHLQITGADKKFLIGKDCTRGLGCGGFPNKGAEAAQESLNQVKEALKVAGYSYATIVRHAKVSSSANLLALPRINVSREYSLQDYKDIVHGKWDYIGLVHRIKGL